MRVLLLSSLLGGVMLLGGCAVGPARLASAATQVAVEPDPATPPAWADQLQPFDKAAFATLDQSWARALAAVPRRQRAKLTGEGPLLNPEVALPAAQLPPGPYACRLIRFGGRAGIAAYAADNCYVEARETGLSLTKQNGATLFEGWLATDTDARVGFTGALRRDPRTTAPAYGIDPALDLAGIVERVAPFRWRLTLLRAGKGAVLDVYELVPITPPLPPAG